MSSNKVNKTTGELVTLANGMRCWIGTKAVHDAAVQAGTMPNNCLVAIVDDWQDATVDVVEDGNMHPVTSNAVYDMLPKVLWTNNNTSTGTESFTIQTSEALSNYDYYEVLFRIKANDSSWDSYGSSGKVPTSHNAYMWAVSIADTESTSNLWTGYRRVKSISGTSVEFGNGYAYSAHASGGAAINWCIPYQIIGYKKKDN